MSKLMNKLSLGLVLSVGVVMVAYYQSETTMEDVGEQIALKLLEILPRKHKMQFNEPEVIQYNTAILQYGITWFLVLGSCCGSTSFCAADKLERDEGETAAAAEGGRGEGSERGG